MSGIIVDMHTAGDGIETRAARPATLMITEIVDLAHAVRAEHGEHAPELDADLDGILSGFGPEEHSLISVYLDRVRATYERHVPRGQ